MMANMLVRLSSKGQLVIPKSFKEKQAKAAEEQARELVARGAPGVPISSSTASGVPRVQAPNAGLASTVLKAGPFG